MDINGLVLRIKKGDEAAFEELYECTRRAVYYTAYSVLREKSAAEGIMQDAFVRFYRNINVLDEKMSAYNYLITTAKNLAINEYKKQKPNVSIEPEKLDFVRSDTSLSDGGGIIEFAARELPPEQFRILVLCALQGYKRREVAVMLGKPLPTVTWLYNKAIRRLQALLEKEETRE